jgi:hypothetical protein
VWFSIRQFLPEAPANSEEHVAKKAKVGTAYVQIVTRKNTSEMLAWCENPRAVVDGVNTMPKAKVSGSPCSITRGLPHTCSLIRSATHW